MLTGSLVWLMMLTSPSLQVAHPPCSTQPDVIKAGSEWLGISRNTRTWWVSGFIDGQAHSFLTWVAEVRPSPSKQAEMTQRLFPMYDSGTLTDVMTSLYQDPANVFISNTAMLYIARAKVSGKDIEPMLRYSRQNDCVFSK